MTTTGQARRLPRHGPEWPLEPERPACLPEGHAARLTTAIAGNGGLRAVREDGRPNSDEPKEASDNSLIRREGMAFKTKEVKIWPGGRFCMHSSLPQGALSL